MTDKSDSVRVRADAARVVNAVVSDGRSLDDALASVPAYAKPSDTAQVSYLSYGVLRSYWRLSEWLASLLQKPLRRRDSIVDALIRVGLYQISDSRVPDHAAVALSVDAARKLRQPKFASLINAVLRNFIRQDLASLPASSEEGEYCHPQWLIDKSREDWPEHWRQILSANNERAPMWLRVSPRHGDASDYLSGLAVAVPGDHRLLAGVDSALRLEHPVGVDELPGFASGVVSVQDGAAQIAAQWLADSDGRRFLDACAAPGGKTGHLLELMNPQATLTALEIDPHRLRQIGQNLSRIGLPATLLTADASATGDWWDGQPFDRILLDAPCSASGVIRRHPDIKMLRRPSDIVELATLQQTLLRSLWGVLAPGGRLLYATCSVFRDENDGIISAFLQQNPDAEEDKVLPNNNIRALMQPKTSGFQVLPGTAGLDGFYYACLRKASTKRTR